MQKMKSALVMAACFAGALGASIPATATAAVSGDASILSTVRHVQSGRCLDGSVSNGVRLNPCNGSKYQEWGTNSAGTVIGHIQSGQCLDGSVSNGVRLNPCNGGAYQQWRSDSSGNRIVHAQSGQCLDGSVSNGVRLQPCNGSTYQTWTN